MSEIETVVRHCKHKDCIYRGYLYWTPFCDYIGVEKKSRGCKISECDKYKPGKKIQPRMQKNYDIDWEWEIFDIRGYFYGRRDEF